MFCIYCGTKLDDDNRFCYKCGKPVTIVSKKNDAGDKKVNPPVGQKAEQSQPYMRQKSTAAGSGAKPQDDVTVAVRSPQVKPSQDDATMAVRSPQVKPSQDDATMAVQSAQIKSAQDNRQAATLRSASGSQLGADEIIPPSKTGGSGSVPVSGNQSANASPAAVKYGAAVPPAEVNRGMTIPPAVVNRGAVPPAAAGSVAANNKTYKWVSISLLIGALLATLTQAWYTVSSALSSIMDFGSWFGIDSLLSEENQKILTSMQNGGLGLIDSCRILQDMADFIRAFGYSDSSYDSALAMYLLVAIAVIGVACIEVLLKALDKKFNFVAFAMYVLALLYTYANAYSFNNELDYELLGISAWPIISCCLAAASGIAWVYYRKSKVQAASNAAGTAPQFGANWNSAETRARAGQIVGQGRDAAELFWQGSWGDYIRHHKAAVILAAAAYIGGAILLRVLHYGDFYVFLRYCQVFFTAMSLGLAAIYADRRDYRFLMILCAISFAGRLISSSGTLSHASVRYLIDALFCDVLTCGVIYLIGRYAKSSALILTTGGAVLTKLILIPLISYGSVYFDSYKTIAATGIVGIVLFYMFKNDVFCTLFGLPEWRFLGADVKRKIICPHCGNEVEAGSAFCSRCGGTM